MDSLILRLNEGDAVVDLYLQRLKTGSGATDITVSELDQLSSLSADGTLYILGHGSTTDIGGYSAASLASLLAKHGMPSSGIEVVLVACNSGTGGAPFALELKVQLVSNKIVPASVSGGTSVMYVTEAGQPQAFQTSGTDWSHVTDETKTVSTPWGSRKVKKGPTYKT